MYVNFLFKIRNHNRLDKNDVAKKNIAYSSSMEIIDVNDSNSPIKLIQPGTLRLASINNNNNTRNIKSNINIESIYLILSYTKPIKYGIKGR